MLIDLGIYDIPGIQIIAWILFSIIEGIREAGKDSHGGSNGNYPFNVHLFYKPNRILVGVLCLCLLSDTKFINLLLIIPSFFLVFPFFHDGAYLMSRRKIEPHKPELINYHWFGWSDTTTAKISLEPEWRIVFVVLGFIVFNLNEIWQRIFGFG